MQSEMHGVNHVPPWKYTRP